MSRHEITLVLGASQMLLAPMIRKADDRLYIDNHLITAFPMMSLYESAIQIKSSSLLLSASS